MNNIRRKRVKALIKELNILEEKIEETLEELETVKLEEEDSRDNIPENLLESQRYEIAENACDNFDSTYTEVDELKSQIEEIVTYLENCVGG